MSKTYGPPNDWYLRRPGSRSRAAADRVPPAGILGEVLQGGRRTLPAVAVSADARRVDARGRLHLSETTTALGWQPGSELRVEMAENNMVVLSRTSEPAIEAERSRIDDRGRVVLPLWIRRSAHLDTTPAVLAVADPNEERILILGAAVLLSLAVG